MHCLNARALRLIAVVGGLVVAAACGGSSTSSSVVAPTGTVTTETIMGTLNPPVGGVLQFNVHPFTVATAGGSINITLLSAGPPPTIQLGLGLGNPSSTGSCAIIPGFVITTAAGSTAQLPASGAPSGAFCVVVADVGNVLQPVSYTLTVAHT